MKNQIKTDAFKFSFIAIVLVVVIACTNIKNNETQAVPIVGLIETQFENNIEEKDFQFIMDVAGMNIEEIHLGHLAQVNSGLKEVKLLGERMEREHGRALADLTSLANKKMIVVPTTLTDDAKDNLAKLNKKSGATFNNEYCEKMVEGHKEAIELFERASLECADLDVREWASSTLPTLRVNLVYAISCQKKCNQIYSRTGNTTSQLTKTFNN